MNLLVDLIPAKQRKWLYGILTVLVAAYGVWQATGGDWTQLIVSLITSAVTGLATANTNVKPVEDPAASGE